MEIVRNRIRVDLKSQYKIPASAHLNTQYTYLNTKNMKKLFAALALLSASHLSADAQILQQAGPTKLADWYNLSFEDDGVYGASVNKAYTFLQGMRMKKQPIVAVIGTGMDIEHEDLKQSIWTNPKEKDDGKDNDRNGWIDDIHGWNFLGNSDGESIEDIPSQVDREFLRLRNKYEGVFYTGSHYVRFDSVENKPVIINDSIDRQEFQYFRNLGVYSRLAGAASGAHLTKFMRYYLQHDFDSEIKASYPDTNMVTASEFSRLSVMGEDGQVDSVKLLAHAFLSSFMSASSMMTENNAPITYPSFKSYYLSTDSASFKTFQKHLSELPIGRSFMGDDENDIRQKGYGNNNLYAQNAYSGVLSSGIIAAARGNGLGIDGIAPQARLMGLRVYDTNSETYLKDLALAIRYAVDHHADIILLGFPYKFYPPHQSSWVDEALRYAEKKGVLVVAPVQDGSESIDHIDFYPNKYLSNGKILNNFITVAASDSTGTPLTYSNYGRERLDFFAPGVNVSSTYLGDTYREASSSLIAAASTAGVAAMIKSYFPQLTANQLRNLLIDNVRKMEDVEVEKGIIVNRSPVKDLFLFSELCHSGGLLDAYKAVQAAEKMLKK
jgi:subtilisin family serine protease